MSDYLAQSMNEFTDSADLLSSPSFQGSVAEGGGPTWLQAITHLLSFWGHLKNRNKPPSRETCKILGKKDAVFTS